MSKERSQKRSTGKLIVHIILIVGALLMNGPVYLDDPDLFHEFGRVNAGTAGNHSGSARWQNYQRVFTSFPL